MTPIEELLDSWLVRLDERLADAIGLRHELHRHPDLSGEEFSTTERVVRALSLEDGGTPVANAGRLLRIGPKEGPTIALRGELDALPIEERTGLPHASENGAMHACGHDLHLAAVALVAAAAREMPLPYGLLVTLQPREETYPSGARDIVVSGQLRTHEVAAMIGLHVQPGLPDRAVSTGAGPVNAAADEFTLTVRGLGGHPAYPHLARDPIVAAAHVVLALQQVIARRTNPMRPAVLSIGSIQGGEAANVIPDAVTLRGSLRTLRPEDRDPLRQLLVTIATQSAASAGCSAEVDIEPGEPVLVNSPPLVASVDPMLRAIGIDVADPPRSCGADDFSYYGEQIPSLMMFLGVPESASGLHRSDFYPPDRLIRDAARALAAAYCGAADLLVNSSSEECSAAVNADGLPVQAPSFMPRSPSGNSDRRDEHEGDARG